jgi:hypothetical protein
MEFRQRTHRGFSPPVRLWKKSGWIERERTCNSGVHERGTPLIIFCVKLSLAAETIASAALADLPMHAPAHPGLPFTLHTPMLKDAA